MELIRINGAVLAPKRGQGNYFFFHVAFHINSLFLVVKSSFQGLAGLPNFVFILRPGLEQQNNNEKRHCHQHFLGLFGG